MLKHQVRSVEQAFAYILDCNLATISSMAMLKKVVKSEFKRQIRIAQNMMDWAADYDIDIKGTRGEEIREQGLTVEEWATAIRDRWFKLGETHGRGLSRNARIALL